MPSTRSESLPSPYPSGSNSSLSASTATLRASISSRPQRPQSASRRSTPASSPTNGTAGRRLPTPNANASSTSLSAAAAKSPRVPVPDPPARFRTIPHLPNMVNVEPAPPPVMYWSKAPVWGTLPTHGFRAHTVTLADNVAWIFGGCDEKGCFKDMWCFNTGACARHPSPTEWAKLTPFSDRRNDAVDPSRDAGRPPTTVPRTLRDSCRSQDSHNWWGRERLVLQ